MIYAFHLCVINTFHCKNVHFWHDWFQGFFVYLITKNNDQSILIVYVLWRIPISLDDFLQSMEIIRSFTVQPLFAWIGGGLNASSNSILNWLNCSNIMKFMTWTIVRYIDISSSISIFQILYSFIPNENSVDE